MVTPPQPRELEPRFEVNGRKGCFAGHEHERATLFDGHFRRAVEHIRADTVGDGRRRARAARNDNHPRSEQTAAGNQCGLVAHVNQRHVARLRPADSGFLKRLIQLLLPDKPAVAAARHVERHAVRRQPRNATLSQRRATGSRNADNDRQVPNFDSFHSRSLSPVIAQMLCDSETASRGLSRTSRHGAKDYRPTPASDWKEHSRLAEFNRDTLSPAKPSQESPSFAAERPKPAQAPLSAPIVALRLHRNELLTG